MTTERVAEAARRYGPILDKACATACANMWGEGGYSDFELREGNEELWKLSEGQDLAYDRPSIGLHYALLYHLERTHLLVRGLIPLLANRHKPLMIYDVGCGTGATAWAVAVILQACRQAGVDVPRVRLMGLDTSPFMLKAADYLWNTLPDTFNRRFSPVNQLGTWDRTEVAIDRDSDGLVVGSYLFNTSDHYHLPEVDAGLTRFCDRLDVDRLLLLTAWRKTFLADELVERGNWYRDKSFLPYGVNLWDNIPSRTDGLRRKLWEHLKRTSTVFDRPYGSPRWERGYSQEYRFLARTIYIDGQLFRTGNIWDRLSKSQSSIAKPDRRLTYVVGPAGSGKSVVLVERLVQTLKMAAPSEPPWILVTSFNKAMVDKLIDWTLERVEVAQHVRIVPGSEQGDRCNFDWTIQVNNSRSVISTIRFINLDKIPTKIWKESDLDIELFEESGTGTRRSDCPPTKGTLGYDQNFIRNELELIVYGLEVMSYQKYVDPQRTRRVGRGRRLQREERIAIWPLLKECAESDKMKFLRRRMKAWRYNEVALFSGGQMALQPSCPAWTHVFVDEGQDMTRADKRMLALTPRARGRLFIVGDSAQALHNHGIAPQPRVSGASWVVPRLEGSYRLPALMSAALADLAESVLGRQKSRGSGGYGGVPRVSRSAVPGPRPVIVSGTDHDGMSQAMEAMGSFDTEADGSEMTWYTVQAIGATSGIFWNIKALPINGRIQRLIMVKHKGLERPLVVFPTDVQPPAGKSVPEWVYAALTRARAVLVIAVDPQETDAKVAEALRKLDRDKLMFWNWQARDAWETMTAGKT